MALEAEDGQRLNIDFFQNLINLMNSATMEVVEVKEDGTLSNKNSGKFFKCINPVQIEIPATIGFFCWIHNISDDTCIIDETIKLQPSQYFFGQIDSLGELSYIISSDAKPLIKIESIDTDFNPDINYNGYLIKIIEPINVLLPDTYEGYNIYLLNQSKGDITITVENKENPENGLKINDKKILKLKKTTSGFFICRGDHDGYNALIFGGGTSKEIKGIKEQSDVKNIDSGNILLVKKAMTLTLPIIEELDIYVKRAFNDGNLILQGNSGTIDGEATLELANYDTAHLYCDGTDYYLL